MLEPSVINRIRHIFLHPRPHVSISQATDLLGWSRAGMKAAIAAGEVVVMETPLGKWVWREELIAKALELWPREAIEEALGAEADGVLPRAVRLAELRARIPRYQLAMLTYFAEQQQTTVSDVLTRELEGVASEHAVELSAVVPGFGAALAWPDAESVQLPAERRPEGRGGGGESRLAGEISLSATRISATTRTVSLSLRTIFISAKRTSLR